jgi:hypothetical protein
MKTDLLTRAAGLSFEAAKRAGSLALSATRYVADEVHKRRSSDAGGGDEPYAPPAPAPEPGEPSRPPRAAAATPPPPVPVREARPEPEPPPPEPEPEPDHVDRGAVVVGEFADTGAQDGPGAELHVEEPWDGYGELTAKEVIDQLADASAATLAVVRLYESTHRDRVTVLAAIDRQLAV